METTHDPQRSSHGIGPQTCPGDGAIGSTLEVDIRGTRSKRTIGLKGTRGSRC